MPEYARIIGTTVVEVVNIPDTWFNALKTAGNPKANFYRKVTDSAKPTPGPTQTLTFTWSVLSASARRNWTLREKTAEELRKVWTSYEFLNRLTQSERSSCFEHAKTNPMTADFLMLCQAAQEVVSDDPATVAGMNYLVAVGLLTEARKTEILS